MREKIKKRGKGEVETRERDNRESEKVREGGRESDRE